jgi:hypothetical protein
LELAVQAACLQMEVWVEVPRLAVLLLLAVGLALLLIILEATAAPVAAGLVLLRWEEQAILLALLRLKETTGAKGQPRQTTEMAVAVAHLLLAQTELLLLVVMAALEQHHLSLAYRLLMLAAVAAAHITAVLLEQAARVVAEMQVQRQIQTATPESQTPAAVVVALAMPI